MRQYSLDVYAILETPAIRNRAELFHGDADDTPLLAEAILGQGTILTPVEYYRTFRLRLCRPNDLLTPTLKLKPHLILQRYKEIIDDIYNEHNVSI